METVVGPPVGEVSEPVLGPTLGLTLEVVPDGALELTLGAADGTKDEILETLGAAEGPSVALDPAEGVKDVIGAAVEVP